MRAQAVPGGSGGTEARSAEIKLTARLSAAAEAVRSGAKLADVGCDHGRLCAFLVASGRCPSAVATDINEKPLAKAGALFKRLGLEGRARALLCDGLAGLSSREADDVVIAGLGFETVAGIIAAAAWLRDGAKRLILVPSSRHARLRRWLWREGFDIIREKAVCEGAYCYTVMTAAYSGAAKEASAAEAALGRTWDGSEEAKRYAEREYLRARRVAENAADRQKRMEAREVMEYIERELNIK
jgi:tRNA (adenine22-N1)-methyltransferase